MKATLTATKLAISFSFIFSANVFAENQYPEAEMQQEMMELEMAQAAEAGFSHQTMVELIDEMAWYQNLCPLGGVSGKLVPAEGGKAIVISCSNGAHFDKFIIDEAVEDVFYRWGFVEDFVSIGIDQNGLINEITVLPHERLSFPGGFMRDYGEPKNLIPEVSPPVSSFETPRFTL